MRRRRRRRRRHLQLSRALGENQGRAAWRGKAAMGVRFRQRRLDTAFANHAGPIRMARIVTRWSVRGQTMNRLALLPTIFATGSLFPREVTTVRVEGTADHRTIQAAVTVCSSQESHT